MSPAEIVGFRSALGCSPVEAARLVGVDGRTWSRWEKGVASPSGGSGVVLRLLADVAGNDPSFADRLRSAVLRGGLSWIVTCAVEGRRL